MNCFDTWNNEYSTCGMKCCIHCEKPLSDKYECACGEFENFDSCNECRKHHGYTEVEE